MRWWFQNTESQNPVFWMYKSPVWLLMSAYWSHSICFVIFSVACFNFKSKPESHKLHLNPFRENLQPYRPLEPQGARNQSACKNISQKYLKKKKRKVWTFNGLCTNSWTFFPPDFLKTKEKSRIKKPPRCWLRFHLSKKTSSVCSCEI